MSRFRARDPLDRIFEIGIILKGLDGVLETLGGLLLFAVTPTTIDRLVARLTQHELSEDPNDFIARHLLRYAHNLTGSAVAFAAVYLLIHGIIKIVLVVALLRNQAWAYPWMIGFSAGLHRLPAVPPGSVPNIRAHGPHDFRCTDCLADLARVAQTDRRPCGRPSGLRATPRARPA